VLFIADTEQVKGEWSFLQFYWGGGDDAPDLSPDDTPGRPYYPPSGGGGYNPELVITF
jgi:hypothetical protein